MNHRPPFSRPVRTPDRPGHAQAPLILLALVLTLLPVPRAGACRYNVRDVGFVDLETEPYRLYAFIREATPSNEVAVLTRSAEREIRNANVLFELVNADTQPRHPALVHRPVSASGPEPVAVLLSPDEQSRRVPLTRPGVAFTESGPTALRELVTSPARQSLVDAVSRTFGAVLLLEGTRAESNQRARRIIGEAIDQLRPQMKLLPKAIAEPPALVALDLAAQAREEVLLWSLRLATGSVAEARAAVIYGRTRWIGPMMVGEEISTRNLVGVFSMIGADCECGLDLSWTQGTRLPVAWPDALRAPLAKALGFDPENPLVKTEVSWILGRRGSGPPGAGQSAPVPGGKSPAEVASGAPPAVATQSPAVTRANSASGPGRGAKSADSVAGVTAGERPGSTPGFAWLPILGFLVAVFLGGALLAWAAARRSR